MVDIVSLVEDKNIDSVLPNGIGNSQEVIAVVVLLLYSSFRPKTHGNICMVSRGWSKNFSLDYILENANVVNIAGTTKGILRTWKRNLWGMSNYEPYWHRILTS